MISTLIKILILTVFFYFFTIFQSSYLSFFTSFDLILALVLLINILEEPEGRLGIFSAFIAGLFIDIYSAGPLGFTALVFLLSSYILKFILFKYVRIPSLSWLPKI